jgi:hypothetical protein
MTMMIIMIIIIIKDTCIALILLWALSAHSHTTGYATWVTLESRLHNDDDNDSETTQWFEKDHSRHGIVLK